MTEKSELSVQIAKVSRKMIETTDQKEHNFQLTKIGEKRKARMTTINFISIRGQQNVRMRQKKNLIEIKIENDKRRSDVFLAKIRCPRTPLTENLTPYAYSQYIKDT